MNAELFARIYFLFMGACLSSIDKTVLVNSTNSALLISILNNSLLNSFLKRLGFIVTSLQKFIVSAVNDFWF